MPDDNYPQETMAELLAFWYESGNELDLDTPSESNTDTEPEPEEEDDDDNIQISYDFVHGDTSNLSNETVQLSALHASDIGKFHP